ncbi:toxin-antitoxin system, antitoxin component, HicB family [Oribacterium sp. oral taxon 078 str. F0263]|uniref:type II toxin-antitoxin system HicB family antitoxin n=1 Tax=Oribacterium sp. oral taxon 078 TaxID=652706 RepID=UPI0003AE535F|nr:HicB family protein [Oribacterium sp. oral taxon 078]ERL20967.1 toxin-antitoxin system, antitoxin component, HicB family [Oribacterium sp. oral taxon 078 str. F0263]
MQELSLPVFHDKPRTAIAFVCAEESLIYKYFYMCYFGISIKKAERYFYPAVFGYEDGKEISVFFPDLDVATSGENEQDALISARELLGITMFGLEEDGEPIPEPSQLSNLQTTGNERAVLTDVYMPSIRMANVNKAVNRTITLPAWLNAAALERNVNFSQVLQEALKQKLNRT